MKKIYLVKKDPKQPAGEDNWIVMNGYDFVQFIRTDEGRSRSQNFSKVASVNPDDPIVIIESDAETAYRNHKESERETYNAECNENTGYKVISLNAVSSDDGHVIDGECFIADLETDVEAEAIRHLELEALTRAILLLPEEDKILLEEMYLKERLTEKGYAERHGISQKGANKRKHNVLLKLRKIMEEN